MKALKIGAYPETAAAMAGINKSTLYDWLKRGARAQEQGDWPANEQPYVEFSNAVKKAIAESEVGDLGIIARASVTQWQAAAWRLERRHPDRWGRKEYRNVSAVNVNASLEDLTRALQLTDEQMEEAEAERQLFLEERMDPGAAGGNGNGRK